MQRRRFTAALAATVAAPLVAAVNNDAPFKTAKDLLAYAKANPGKISYGSSGDWPISDTAAKSFFGS